MRVLRESLSCKAFFGLIFIACSGVVARAEVTTTYEVATQWGTIEATGPRASTNGNRFLNSAGSTSGSAADAYIRFDVTGLKTQLTNGLGTSNWFLQNIELALTQSNFVGSTAGGVSLYHILDDSVAITNGEAGDGPGDDFSGLPASNLVFGDWSGLSLGNGGNPVLTYTFTPTATGDVDTYGVADGMDISSMANWIESNDFLTFVAVADDGTFATYKGNEFSGRLPPQMRFTASAVPEPSSALALIAVSGACIVRRLRKNRKA